jgi:hypothetical protein
MKCFFCYNNLVHVNPNTKERKGHIIHYESYGITILKKHVEGDHAIIVKNLNKK